MLQCCNAVSLSVLFAKKSSFISLTLGNLHKNTDSSAILRSIAYFKRQEVQTFNMIISSSVNVSIINIPSLDCILTKYVVVF